MTELLNAYWPAILVAVFIGLIVGLVLFRPRQSVRLTDSAPFRPHMASSRDSRAKANDIASEAAAAACDMSGEIIGAPVHRHLSADGGALDDFQRIKGVGPKLADMLHARGFARFEQLAHLTSEEGHARQAARAEFRSAPPRTHRRAGDLSGARRHRTVSSSVWQALASGADSPRQIG